MAEAQFLILREPNSTWPPDRDGIPTVWGTPVVDRDGNPTVENPRTIYVPQFRHG